MKVVIESTPDDHFAPRPDCSVIPSCQRHACGARGHPAVCVGIVSPACIEIHHRAAKHSAPDDHFAAGPHRGMRVSRRGRIVETRAEPTVRARIISPAAVRVSEGFIHAAPDNHFALAPYCRVTDSAERDIDETGRHPTVSSGAVSAAGVQIVYRITPTPDNHFAISPHCSMVPSCGRRIHGAGRCPTVRAGIVSPAAIQVAVSATSKAGPDDHLAASPDRRVIGSCGRCISGAGRCPTVGYRIVSAACVQ